MNIRSYVRYALGVLLLIGAIILMIVLFNVIRNSFRQTDTSPAIQAPNEKVLNESASKGLPVQFTVRGIVNAQETHRSIRITVDRSTRTIDVLEGYNGKVIKTQTFPNTTEAYNSFIDSLEGAGFAKRAVGDNRGVEGVTCPLGLLYTYEIDPGVNPAVLRTWSTSCSSNQGSFTGNRIQVQTLFQRQIPDYNGFTSGITLGA